MNRKDLEYLEIKDWDSIKQNYSKPNLLLGNGFSINFSKKFNYDSLFEIFLEKLDNTYKKLFKSFDTANFELILKHLEYSIKVNDIFGIETNQIERAVDVLKKGLIEAINEVHPRVSALDWTKIENVAKRMEDFKNIYTTNYDLFLYHIVMKSNDLYRNSEVLNPYQDYFWGDENTRFKRFMDYQDRKYYKHIYYLHGALFIYNQGIADLKLRLKESDDELIVKISEEISNGNFPLFVTEGHSEDKLKAISYSNYLYFCFNNFKHQQEPIMIFGNSLNKDHDKHIINVLNQFERDMIYAIYIGDKNEDKLNLEKFEFINKFPNFSKSIEFVDSATVFD